MVIDLSESQRAIVENKESRSELAALESLPLLEPNTDHSAFIQKLPQALSYVAELESGSHAILFYDNLVAAAEYLCAFVEEGIHRRETTSFIGLTPERYKALFDQVGLSTNMLENCGYLVHPSIEEVYGDNGASAGKKTQINYETLLRTNIECECQGTRFILLNEYPLQSTSFRELMDFERWLNKRSSTTVLCCYDAKQVLEETYYNLFTELLKTHGHCIFQGFAMPTATITNDRSFKHAKRVELNDELSPL